MKKIIFKTVTLLFAASIFILGSCTKQNVKHGNKRIIGTWKLIAQKNNFIEKGNRDYIFSENDCDYNNYSTSFTYIDSIIVDGNTVHEYSTETETYNGETSTEKEDTVYTENYLYEITFNEDGTCKIKDEYFHKDDNGYENNFGDEYTGYWSWIDSYEEKSGILLDFSSVYDDKRSLDGIMRLYIKSLDKKQLITEYNVTYTETYEYTSLWDTCNDKDVYRTSKITNSGSGYGTRTFEKVK